MPHFFAFSVEPLPSHPRFWELQAGWAYVVVRDDSDDSEERARAHVNAHHYKIQTLQDARQINPEQVHLLPEDVRANLPHHPILMEVVAYPTGSGDEEAGNPFFRRV